MATVKFSRNKLIRSALNQILPSVARAAPRTTQGLAQSSPNRTGKLAQGWYHTVPRIQGAALAWEWGNRGEFALQSIVGRGPGGQTPTSALLPWIHQTLFLRNQQALGLAFAIGMTHATKGSQNFRTGQNDLDLERDGTPRSGGVAHRILYDEFIANLQ